MPDPTEAPKKSRGRPSQGGREHGRLAVYLRPEVLGSIEKLAEAATKAAGRPISKSTVASLIIEAGFDQVSVEGIARDAP